MKITVDRPQEVDILAIQVNIAVRYDEEDIPNDFPGREGDMWNGIIHIESGKIKGWGGGKRTLAMKVCDQGSYRLLDCRGIAIAEIDNDYVPSCIPGEYGDYIDFSILEDGTIERWNEFCTEDNIKKSFFTEK